MMHRHYTALWALLALLLLPSCPDAGWHGDTGDAGVDAGATCGNGVVEEGEECDDGNSDNNDGCCNSCLVCNACSVSQWDRCTPGESVCCPSAEDVPTECAVHATDPESHRCLRGCESAADCYWSNECGPTFDGHCWPTYCGQDRGTDVNAPCAVADATGYCYPQGSAQDAWGLCIEPGTLPAGTLCERGHYLDEIPRTVETCANGICSAWVADVAPVCMDFCDPMVAYDATQVGADACPAGFNCLSMSYISAYSHLRTADKGWCVPTPSTDASGLGSCDLLGGGLIADRTQVCDNLLPGTLCGFWRDGSLMGTCQEFDATGMSLTLGDPCDAATHQPACGESLLCSGMDPFGPADATDFHCLQVCDAADPSWVCDATDLVCTSLSVAHYTTDVTTDGSPTRLGLCAPPPTP
jgi:cysteine-rich repeat protein